MRIVYSEAYEVNIGRHVFPTVKFRLIRQKLLQEKLIPSCDFLSACAASREQLLLVHTKQYLDKLEQGTLSPQELSILELPYSDALVKAARICAGGTILASKIAWQDGIGIHLGGGFHHAFSDRGEGFCVLNDVACAAKFCRKEKLCDKIMIVDCDLHQGNGSADIFRDERSVFTFSIHQQNNYPAVKPPSNLDIGLEDGTGDEGYLEALGGALPKIIQAFRPQLIFYIAGADPYLKDQLGGLELTLAGLKRRDEFVFSQARQNAVKVAVVLGGGYAWDIEDTVTIHYNTVKEALKIFQTNGVRGGLGR